MFPYAMDKAGVYILIEMSRSAVVCRLAKPQWSAFLLEWVDWS